MDVHVPTAEDHCRISILVRTIGPRSATTFNRLMERLSRVEAIQVSDNPKRVILANFVTAVNPELTKFGELQAYRKIFGMIGVAQCSHSAANSIHEPASRGQSAEPEAVDPGAIQEALNRQRYSGEGPSSQCLESIAKQYMEYKRELSDGLVDSRCVLFGFNDPESVFETVELLSFPSLEDSEEFENGVRELIRAIYFILESRRLDTTGLKLEQPHCPTLPEEEKTKVGTENKQSKVYKRKCIGRLRKQLADYALLTGLPSLALDSYNQAIECLRYSMDLLWLAAAYEGYACAAMAIKYNETAERWRKQATIHRVSTMTPDQLREYQGKTQHDLGVTIGHQRYRSDEDQRALATAAAAAAQLIEQDQQTRRTNKRPWGILNSDRSPSGRSMSPEDIIERFTLALEHYERFSFASFIEYECMVRASSVFRHHRKYIETEQFLRERVGKYLDDSFTLFDNTIKAHICMAYAQIFRDIGFRRKTAFFSRLAVLFRLHVNDSEVRTEGDYKLVYPILYRTLVGYGISDSGRDAINNGPVAVQVKAMHEVFMSAQRARFDDAAIRHLCYILQTYFHELESEAVRKMLDELTRLVQKQPKMHSLAQHISLDQSGIMLPPLQMTRFPMITDFKIVTLPAHLAPKVLEAGKNEKVFIYSPFETAEANRIYWVTNCGCEVSVKVLNPLPIDLMVKNLSLLTEGCTFESIPIRLNLPAFVLGTEPTEIKLLGMPKAPGKLTITGYSCEVLGVRNVCSIKEVPTKPSEEKTEEGKVCTNYTVEVLREVPLLQLDSSLQRAPTTDDGAECVAEATVFSGQSFSHSVAITNTSSSIPIKTVFLSIRQPVVFGPQLIELTDLRMTKGEDDLFPVAKIENLEPGEKRDIQFQIFGIDPASMADDKSVGEEQRVLIKPAHSASSDNLDDAASGSSSPESNQRNSIVSFSDELSHLSLGNEHDLIPYTGRLLTASLVFRYVVDVEGLPDVQYERTCSLSMAICIVPALTVSHWHVLPGDSPSTRYVVIDVTNSTEHDAELIYSADRRKITVQPKEVCRVPVLCPCCPDVSSRSFREAASYDSIVRRKQELDILRRCLETHIAKHLQIRWAIPQLNYTGIVPIGSVLAEVEFLKQLVVPTVSVYARVNGKCHDNEDITVAIGELVDVELGVTSVLRGTKPVKGELTLRCYQDLANGKPPIEGPENMLFCGPERVPVVIDPLPPDRGRRSRSNSVNQEGVEVLQKERLMPTSEFSFLFLYEGSLKVRPVIGKPSCLNSEPSLADDEVFVPTISFNVVTKV